MKFSDIREGIESEKVAVTDFEKGEQKIRQVMIRNLLLKKEKVRTLTEDSTSYQKGSIAQGCIGDGALRGKKGVHTKDLY